MPLDKVIINKRCGDCAAFPCFRDYKTNYPAGLCFQVVRQCKSECDNYIPHEMIDENGRITHNPANGGKCKISGREVAYCQECHVPEMQTKKK